MYTFSMNIKLSMLGVVPASLADNFPNAEDLVIGSKEFETMMETVSICKDALVEVVLAVNHAQDREKFKILNELNPTVSGTPTISKDWADNEIAKMWMVESGVDTSKTKKIHAFALAQVWQSEEDSTSA